jgi:hypothetical protein
VARRLRQAPSALHADDVAKLREKVSAMTPEEAAKWWEEKAPEREALSSEEWLETEAWLKKFLNVQAIYSDEDIRAVQAEAAEDAKESAESLDKVLDRITQARLKLVASNKSAADMRKEQVAAVDAYKKEQVREREEARRQAAKAPKSVTPEPIQQRRRVRYNEPLIDSLDVARWATLRRVYPRW